MQTLLLPASENANAKAAQLIKNGEIVGVPTETVYGLAASSFSDEAVRKIYAAKGRPSDNPLISHIADIDMLALTSREIPSGAYALAEAFWPGPLTIILKRGEKIADSVCAGLDTAAVRMPSHSVARDIIRKSGVPFAAPSANLSGSPSPTTAQTVLDDMDGKIPLIIDGGECEVGVESTVITLATEKPMLLRPGFITLKQLENALGCEVLLSDAVLNKLKDGETAASPGMKYKHYAPKAEITILKGSFAAYNDYVQSHADDETVCLCFDGEEALIGTKCVTYGAENDDASQAHKLFSALRQLDDIGAKTVFARAPKSTGVAMAVYNRLLRAAAFRVIQL